MDQDNTPEEEEAGGGGFQIEILRSYLAFVKRALRQRLWLVALVTVVGLALTAFVFVHFPRKYNCTTILMAQKNEVLDSFGAPHPLDGAASLIMRHENLEAIVRETDLLRKFKERRPKILALKDKLFAAVFGELDEKTQIDVQVGSLESRMNVHVDNGGNLVVSVDWTDAKTAAELAEAARESFLRSRHTQEISAFQEKMSILEGHAIKLRKEAEELAEQINTLRTQRAAEARPTAAQAPAAAPAPAPAPAPVVRSATRKALTDDRIPVLKEKLATQKQKLSTLEAEREQRIREERRKLDELKLRLTPSHPEVVTQEQRLRIVSAVPSEIALLRSEVSSLEAEIKQRETLAKAPASGGSRASATQAGAPGEALPTDIIRLLDDDDADPVLTSQLSGAITKYGVVRDDIREARIALDTAQAAFNHRYRVVVPADPPNKPYKPKPAVLIGGGLFLTLVLALALPILAELRTGIIVERWQVQLVELPVLAELRLPPHSAD